MKTTPLDGAAFGAQIVGLHAATLTEPQAAALLAELFRHRVLVLRGQELSPEQYLEFTGKLGRPIEHVLQNLTVPGFPSLLQISDHIRPDGSAAGVLDGGSYWHSDMAYLPLLGVATALYAVRAVGRSAPTTFLDLVPAWPIAAERAELLALLGGITADAAAALTVRHRLGNRQAQYDKSAAAQQLSGEQADSLTGAAHRLVERHPVTGAAVLFAPLGSAMAIDGLPDQASRDALDAIEHLVLAELPRYTHHYRPGDLVLWDNMSTLHRGEVVTATRDEEQSRLLYRVNIQYTDAEAGR